MAHGAASGCVRHSNRRYALPSARSPVDTPLSHLLRPSTSCVSPGHGCKEETDCVCQPGYDLGSVNQLTFVGSVVRDDLYNEPVGFFTGFTPTPVRKPPRSLAGVTFNPNIKIKHKRIQNSLYTTRIKLIYKTCCKQLMKSSVHSAPSRV